MSVWIELRCADSAEQHSNPIETGKYTRSGVLEVSECWSHDNSGAGQMSASSTQKSILETYSEISDVAKNSGWTRINRQWVCPHCSKYHGDK